jgi:alanine dehydrogenase
MRIGVPRETKTHEYRVAMVPAGVREMVGAGHQVFVESAAGAGIGESDAAYEAAGAIVVATADEVYERAELVVKVKEPQPVECERLREGQILFAYLHLAADPAQAEAIVRSGATAIAYETVQLPDGSLPLLTPMSEVAGRMSIQVGAAALQRPAGGSGVLLGGVPGVRPGRVVILGGGVAGTHAAEMAIGLQADVTVVDRSIRRLQDLAARFGSSLRTEYSTAEAIHRLVENADLVIGAVLVAGATTPRLVDRALLRRMKPGSVVVDVAIDQGGCFETSRPTTHQEPTFVVDEVVHYCVANMPGAVPRTSTFALANATLRYVRSIADLGAEAALRRDTALAAGLNVQGGKIVHAVVQRSLETRRSH